MDDGIVDCKEVIAIKISYILNIDVQQVFC